MAPETYVSSPFNLDLAAGQKKNLLNSVAVAGLEFMT